jgi:hypothetical protein
VTSLSTDHPESLNNPARSYLRRPPLWLAITVSVVAIIGMAVLRLVIFPHKVVPIAYGVPLILFVWLRHRGLLWFTVAAFTAISVIKFFFALANENPENITLGIRLFDFILIQIDLIFIGGAMHWLIDARDRLRPARRSLSGATLSSSRSTANLPRARKRSRGRTRSCRARPRSSSARAKSYASATESSAAASVSPRRCCRSAAA